MAALLVDENGRECTGCTKYKDWDSYYRNTGRGPYGRDTKCKECTNSTNTPQNRLYRKRLKEKVMSGYGGSCRCCGESELDFLVIDHINNDGAEHRRNSKFAKSNRLYRWLRDNDYPDGFQVLCANCNQAKQIAGSCPHQRNGES